MRDRLVARNGDVPDEAGTSSTLTARRAPERRAQRTLRLQKLRGAAGLALARNEA